jgi:hypothetical protein
MLTKGENTYADIETADDYINGTYYEYNPLRVHWSVLTDGEKEMYLKQSLVQIERLPFRGQKYYYRQKLMFPRFDPQSKYSGCYAGSYIFRPLYSAEIPEELATAQAENALGILQKEISSVTSRQSKSMQSLGAVKDIKNSVVQSSLTVNMPLTSTKAYEMLRGWLGGLRC